LRVTGPEKQKFRFRGEVLAVRAGLENGADPFRDRCASGRACDHDLASGELQFFGEKVNLSAFSASLHSFERDEQTFFHVKNPSFRALFASGHLRFGP